MKGDLKLLREIADSSDESNSGSKYISFDLGKTLMSSVSVVECENDFIKNSFHCIKTLINFALGCDGLQHFDMSGYDSFGKELFLRTGLVISSINDFKFNIDSVCDINIKLYFDDSFYYKLKDMVDDFYFHSIGDLVRFLLSFSLNKFFDNSWVDIEVKYQHERSEVLEENIQNYLNKFGGSLSLEEDK